MKVGSFSAGKKCGYDDAQSLAIYEKYFSLPACGPDKKGGVQKEMKLYTSAAIARWLDLTERRVRQLRDKKS